VQGSASESTLVALLAARARALAGRPMEDAGNLVAYSSDQVRTRSRLPLIRMCCSSRMT
jgi:aromatic-L-amino-acid decarboxylase